MANSNGSKTVQIDASLAKEISILAAKTETTRKNILDNIISEYLQNIKGDDIV